MRVRAHLTALLFLAGISPAVPAPAELDDSALNSSAICAECHEDIHAMWSRSLHSLATTDPVFEASYLQAYRQTGGAAREICLRCHAPAAVLSGDLDLSEPVSQEGITCDFCHSVAAVNLENRDQPFEVVLDGAKRGPLSGADSPAHDVKDSPLHKSSEFCAGCHEYTNEQGVPVLSTYTEWKTSPQAAQGVTCQECHMPMTKGLTVGPAYGSGRGQINLHDISGGHSREQVRRAATVEVVEVGRTAPTAAQVVVEVANVGSGHSIPTGMPTRKMILEVVLLSDGREVKRFEYRFNKLLLDAGGKIITEDHRAILDASQVLSDTRLRPGERRRRTFAAVVPRSGVLRAEAKLRYSYEPTILMKKPISVEMASDETSQRP